MSDQRDGASTTSVLPAGRTFVGFNWHYWNCNIIEMWERRAYYTLLP